MAACALPMDSNEPCASRNQACEVPEIEFIPKMLTGNLAAAAARMNSLSDFSCAALLPSLMSSRIMRKTLGGSGASWASSSDAVAPNRPIPKREHKVRVIRSPSDFTTNWVLLRLPRHGGHQYFPRG